MKPGLIFHEKLNCPNAVTPTTLLFGGITNRLGYDSTLLAEWNPSPISFTCSDILSTYIIEFYGYFFADQCPHPPEGTLDCEYRFFVPGITTIDSRRFVLYIDKVKVIDTLVSNLGVKDLTHGFHSIHAILTFPTNLAPDDAQVFLQFEPPRTTGFIDIPSHVFNHD
jgi:hypothetical protein